MEQNYCVMYNSENVIWVWSKDVDYHKSIGWKVYKYASTEPEADKLAEEACYQHNIDKLEAERRI